MFNRISRFLLIAGILLGMFTAKPIQHVEALGTDRYVAKIGGVDSPTCDNPSSPCLNIGYAILNSAASDVIHITAGAYSEHLIIDRNITLAGAGINTTIIDGTSSGLVIEVQSGKNLTVSDLTIQNGNDPINFGGGIYNLLGHLILNRVKITNSHADAGGGIYNDGGNLDLTDVEISANSANAYGGGILNNAGNAYLTNVTLSGNSAGVFGGGIYHQTSGTDSLTNVTISGNTAHLGGALAVEGSTTITITNSTIAGNHIDSSPFASTGGIKNFGSGITMVNSIVSQNDDKDCSLGAVLSYGNNMDGDGTCFPSFLALPSDHPSANPLLSSLAYNGGYVATRALQLGSPAIDAADGAYCPPIDANRKTRPQDGNGDSIPVCDIGAAEAPTLMKFLSVGAYDGWILESTATSSKGGTKNSSASTFLIGDNAARKQYRAILHFNTAGLPATVTISKVTLRMMKSTGGSGNTSTLGALLADIRKPYFGTAASLAITDFQATASKTKIFNTFVKSGSWYSATLKSTGFAYVNRTGTTQFRVYFTKGDDHDSVADYLKFYSGSASTANRPQLVIQYYVP